MNTPLRLAALALAAALGLGTSAAQAKDWTEVKVGILEPTGSETLIFAHLGGQKIDAVIRDRIEAEPGQALSFVLDPGRVHLFDAGTGLRI